MIKVVFQGDSITDAGRNRQKDFNRGYGYSAMASGVIGAQSPGEYIFINRGIGGNRIHDILARNEEDVIAHSPKVVSLLAGVNDVWYYLDKAGGFDSKYYSGVLEEILSGINKSLPKTKIMLFAPFVLPGSNTGLENSEKWAAFKSGTQLCEACTKSVAQRFGCVYTPLQNIFDNAVKEYPDCSYWLMDGIHPTASGHWLITNEWISAFNSIR